MKPSPLVKQSLVTVAASACLFLVMVASNGGLVYVVEQMPAPVAATAKPSETAPQWGGVQANHNPLSNPAPAQPDDPANPIPCYELKPPSLAARPK